jgi:sugar/nucleoside kinase (ribokinase family)
MDVLTIGEALVEFLRQGKDQPHSTMGKYVGPFPSGAPAIFADTAARLGLKSSIIARVGSDDFGELLSERLCTDGVDISHLQKDDQLATGVAFVTYFSNGERRFVFTLRGSSAAQVKPSHIEHNFVTSSKVLHIMGSALSLSNAFREACYKAVRIASRSGIIVSYDPNLRPELVGLRTMRKISAPLLEAAEIVMPSKRELLDLTGKHDIDEASKRLKKHGVKYLVVKMGAEGSLAISDNERAFVPAFHVEEVDATGAGDAFDAAILHEYLRKRTLETSLHFANAVGAMKVTKLGPMEGPKNMFEVATFMKEARRRGMHNHRYEIKVSAKREKVFS